MEPFIEIRGLVKTFAQHGQRVEVLKGVDLDVKKGEIYGIIGFSGAGKSTLVRCLNRMEEPDAGLVRIGALELSALGKRELGVTRQKIGMIFQHFNLFDSRTVAQNVAFPLEVAGWKHRDIRARVHELLRLVELEDKAGDYPGQLSGGQKQRVGIARALANRPEVLLSDEATSALDPQTTLSVLDLLKSINQKLGLTIVLITHELEVVRYLCDRVAVLEDGRITERGSVRQVFLSPQSQTARLFVRISRNFSDGAFVDGGEGI